MFKNYITSALRALLKQKLFSLINILGLAVGLAAGIMIMLFVRFETSYETWLPNSNGIYQVASIFKRDAEPVAQVPWMPGPLRQALIENFPEMPSVVRGAVRTKTFKRGEALFSEEMDLVDPNFFDVFDFEFVKGNRDQVLANINNIAMSETTAEKYFGKENPIGQTVLVNGEDNLVVVAVFKDLPENTELDFEIIGLFDIPSIKDGGYYNEWNSQVLQTYFTLKPGVSLESVVNRFDEFMNRVNPVNDESDKRTNYYSITALPVSDLHLRASTGGDYLPGGGLRTVITFSIVALLVVGVAVFNFVNSSTAIAQLRAKEVAMRKTLGAGRMNLVYQFMGEFAILCAISFALALVFVELSMPAFVSFWDKPISSDYLADPLLLGGLLALFPAIVIGAGYYPAVYLTKFKPAKILMSNQSNNADSGGLRRILVIMQFAVSIGLAIVATIIQMQFTYVTSQELGFDHENKVIVRGIGTDITRDRYTALRKEVEQIEGVNEMTRSFYAIGDGNNSSRSVTAEWLTERTSLRIAPADYNYFELFDVKLLAGRFFDEAYSNDLFEPKFDPENEADDHLSPGTVIINRTALSRLEIATPEEAIGKTILLGMNPGYGRGEMTIVGVVDDFKEKSAREAVRSSVYYNDPKLLFNGSISIKPNSLPNVMTEIEQAWKRIYSDVPLNYEFLDEKLEKRYAPAKRRSEMLFAFAVLAIVISALGLFGLASFTVQRRTKEVGLRKILGASSGQITRLMIHQFSTPILLANVLAWPLAWYLASDWLQAFSYRIEIEPWVFVAYGLAALLLGWITVGGHAWRASQAKPIVALRYE